MYSVDKNISKDGLMLGKVLIIDSVFCFIFCLWILKEVIVFLFFVSLVDIEVNSKVDGVGNVFFLRLIYIYVIFKVRFLRKEEKFW